MKKSIVTLLLVCLTMGSWAVERPKQGFGFQISWAQPILRINRPGTSALNDSLKMAIKMKGFKSLLDNVGTDFINIKPNELQIRAYESRHDLIIDVFNSLF